MSGRAITAESAQSLEQLASALGRKGIPLPHEIGTFLVLESCERLIGQPLVLLGASDVWLSDEGEVAVAGGKPAASEAHAARALVVLLGELLVRSAPGVPQLVLELVERASADDQLTLSALRDDLEATLVPLNRAATRRVLGRLSREARRERERGGSVPAPDSGALDYELDALLGVPAGVPRIKAVEAAAPPPRAEPGPEPARARPVADAAMDRAEHEERAARGPHLAFGDERLVEVEGVRRPSKRRVSESEGAPRPLHPLHRADELETFPEARRGASGLRVAIALLVLTACLLAAYLALGRDGARGVLGLTPDASRQPAAPLEPAAPPDKPRYGELRVSSSPARAQVLLRVGRAPALVPGLPVGVAHELVAIAEGRAPARGVVPADATWTEVDGSLQYELALQLGEAKKGGAAELGATRLPQSTGTPTGAAGNVRVITAPPGAEVYQLIGFTPDVRVENLDVREPTELLVYLSGYEAQRVTLGEGSYKEESGRLVADLEIALKGR